MGENNQANVITQSVNVLPSNKLFFTMALTILQQHIDFNRDTAL